MAANNFEIYESAWELLIWFFPLSKQPFVWIITNKPFQCCRFYTHSLFQLSLQIHSIFISISLLDGIQFVFYKQWAPPKIFLFKNSLKLFQKIKFLCTNFENKIEKLPILHLSLFSSPHSTINKYFITIKYFCLLLLKRGFCFFFTIIIPSIKFQHPSRTHTHISMSSLSLRRYTTITSSVALVVKLCLCVYAHDAFSLVHIVVIVTTSWLANLRIENVLPCQINRKKNCITIQMGKSKFLLASIWQL